MVSGRTAVGSASGDRLDTAVVAAGLAPSREQAQRLILAGKILVNEHVADRPGSRVPAGAALRCKAPLHPYVGRGGVKLEAALQGFGVSAAGKLAADLGASTGGFTDCLLQNGAARVFAVDVGYGQLDYRLRTDPRVVVMDRTNARYLTAERLGAVVDLVVMDLAFISVLKVLEAVWSIVCPGGDVLALMKPQFEIGKGKVGKGGIVRRAEDHGAVLVGLLRAIPERGFGVIGVLPSPVPGAKGNLEFWFHLRPGAPNMVTEGGIRRAVADSHARKRDKAET